jgi:hypothetical protein
MLDLALMLTPSAGLAYWFLFDEGSARYINLISTTDVTLKGWEPPMDAKGGRPLGEMHYFVLAIPLLLIAVKWLLGLYSRNYVMSASDCGFSRSLQHTKDCASSGSVARCHNDLRFITPTPRLA